METTEATRQIATVHDLNKCIGCPTCTIACKKLWNTDTGTGYAYWNNVETLPGAGDPRNWTETGGRTAEGEVKAGKWHVVFEAPTWSSLDARQQLAIAIWQGVTGDRGGLKSVSSGWIAVGS